MADLGQAYVQIIPSAEGISGKIEDVLAPEASKAGKSSGLNIAATLGKALGGALAAIGIKEIITKAIDAGGALEQSFGGLDTIYGDAAAQAKEFAMQASKMGISANDYAEQAVSFGASLKQAFGGDTQKAMQAANTAISDMTDNAAKMGTPIESIQAAYQGFAKQNYTMLDNLKLGYGGTKTEMERLLKDAQAISGVKYDISNLGDVYDAIHVIQGELGLTGVAANEAATTLQGSFNAMKASLQNFLGALTTGMDVSGPLSELIANISTYLFKNLLPAIGNILLAIPTVAQTAFNTIAPMVGTLFKNMIAKTPDFLNSGTNIINKVVTGFINNLPRFISAVGTMVTKFTQYIIQNLPTILQCGVSIILNIVNGIANNYPRIAEAARTAMSNFINMIVQNLPNVLSRGVEILGRLVTGILNAMPRLISAAASAMAQFLQGVANNLPAILAKGGEIIANIVRGILGAIPSVGSAAANIGSRVVSAVTGFNWWGIGGDIISGIARGISGGVGSIVSAARDAAMSAFNAAKRALKIGSPSKVMAKGVGRWIPAGIAVGIRQNMGVIDAAMNDLSAETTATIGADLSTGRYMYGTGGEDVTRGGFNQTVNIYSPQALNPSEVARQTRNATQQMALALSGV